MRDKEKSVKWRDLLDYDSKTGILKWRIRAAHNVFPGMEAGTVNRQGYKVLTYRRNQYQAHRIAFFLLQGYFPKMIDHVNGIRHDNKAVNIRPASIIQQRGNSAVCARNKLQVKGVCLKRGKYEANCAMKYLGRYATPEEAAAAYRRAATMRYREFARV